MCYDVSITLAVIIMRIIGLVFLLTAVYLGTDGNNERGPPLPAALDSRGSHASSFVMRLAASRNIANLPELLRGDSSASLGPGQARHPGRGFV
jgi:hypothetical protein